MSLGLRLPTSARVQLLRSLIAREEAEIAAGVYLWLSQAPESPESAPDLYACGTERWAVKTRSDNQGKLVMEGEPRAASIEELTTWPIPL